MAPATRDQMQTFVDGLFEIRQPKRRDLTARMRYQRWLLSECAMFWPNEPLVEVVLDVIAPRMAVRYPH